MRFSVIAAASGGLLALALTVSAAAEPFSYPTDDDHLLFEYHRYSDKLAVRDPTPRVRLYGSGRLVIYFPTYMRRAGEYETWLSGEEVQTLLATVSEAGVGSINSEQLESDIALAAAAEETLTGTLRYQSEQVSSTFAVDLGDAQPSTLKVVNLLSQAQKR